VNGQGTLDVRGERKRRNCGKLVVILPDMSTLKPLLEAGAETKTELRGSFYLNWRGAFTPKLTENGFLKLAWKKRSTRQYESVDGKHRRYLFASGPRDSDVFYRLGIRMEFQGKSLCQGGSRSWRFQRFSLI